MTKDKLTQDAQAWAKATLDKLKSEFPRLGIVHRENSKSRQPAVDLIRASVRKKFGTVSSVAFKFPRHMVFVHKGVGRGYPASAPRQAKPWFNDVVNKEVEQLADIVAEGAADMVVSTAFDGFGIR